MGTEESTMNTKYAAQQKTKEICKKAEIEKRGSSAPSIAKKEFDRDKIKECQQVIENFFDKELQIMKDEVHGVEEIITDGTPIKSLEDVLLLQYEGLQDSRAVKKNITDLCKGFPALELLIDAATSMIGAVQQTKELKKLFRWQQRKIVQKVPGDRPRDPWKVVGLELHYKVKVVEEKEIAGAVRKVWSSVSDFLKGTNSQEDKKKTIVMLAYKIIAKYMPDLDPDKFLDKEQLHALTF